MASYPATPKALTTITPLSTMRRVAMGDGSPRFRVITDSAQYRIRVEHQHITQAEVNTLQTFASSNLNEDIVITASDGVSYTGRFSQRDYTVVVTSALYRSARIDIEAIKTSDAS